MEHLEANFDGLIGPTHNYAGLAYGNVASLQHKHRTAYPKLAAKQGLRKMKVLADLGLVQGVLPPLQRPDLSALRQLGFRGTDSQMLAHAARQAPAVLTACYSASSMWAANAATVSSAADCDDGRIHITPANLNSQFHRALETQQMAKLLQTLFADRRYFCHHAPLPSYALFADEGAANHNRLCPAYGQRGIELFVYGREAQH